MITWQYIADKQTKQVDCEVTKQLKNAGLNLDKINEDIFATLLKLVKWR